MAPINIKIHFQPSVLRKIFSILNFFKLKFFQSLRYWPLYTASFASFTDLQIVAYIQTCRHFQIVLESFSDRAQSLYNFRWILSAVTRHKFGRGYEYENGNALNFLHRHLEMLRMLDPVCRMSRQP